MAELAGWESFYLIVGSAAGTLIGLQFVALTLIANRPIVTAELAGGAFATPTIVHFASALLLAMLLRAPWEAATIPAVLWGLIGLGGVAYTIVVARRIHRQAAYRPGFEDWLFHFAMPLIAYLTLAASACVDSSYPRGALFSVGATSVLLLIIGIHNAWDAIAYHVFVSRPKTGPGADRPPSPIARDDL